MRKPQLRNPKPLLSAKPSTLNPKFDRFTGPHLATVLADVLLRGLEDERALLGAVLLGSLEVLFAV